MKDKGLRKALSDINMIWGPDSQYPIGVHQVDWHEYTTNTRALLFQLAEAAGLEYRPTEPPEQPRKPNPWVKKRK